MASVAANVRVAVTGAVYVAATGTTAPTSHASTLNAAFLAGELGYVSEDGVTETRERSTEDIRAWQDSTIVRTAVTESAIRFQFTLIETRKAVVEAFYGSAVTDATGLITINPANTGGRKAWVLDVIDGAIVERTYIAEGEITEVGDVVYANGEPIGHEVTVTAYTNPMRWYSQLIV